MIEEKGTDVMKIGEKLRNARAKEKMTQEYVAEKIAVSRQTISNWENEKFYPDIVSVIKLSDLYNISLDELLKGDEAMMGHLEESVNVVNSNQRLLIAIGINIVLLILFLLFNGLIVQNQYLIIASVSVGVSATCFLFYQIIKKF